MLIDEFLPEFHARSQHVRHVRAPVKYVFEAVNQLDLRTSWVSRLLFRLRGIPNSALTLTGLQRLGFQVLATRPDEEVLVGLAGRFWTPKGDIQRLGPQEFRAFNKSGYAKAAWNFYLTPEDEGVDLSTETRVYCLDEWSRREFRIYWTVIAPFSAKIRVDALAGIKRKAEKAWFADAGIRG